MITITPRDYMDNELPNSMSCVDYPHKDHEVFVNEDGVTLTFKRSMFSIYDDNPTITELMFDMEKSDEDSDEVTETSHYYNFKDGAEEAFVEALKNIVVRKVPTVNDEIEGSDGVGFYVEIPDSGDVDMLELSIMFTGDYYLDMPEEAFQSFIWDYVATFYNMDDAGTFNHPYLYWNAVKAFEAHQRNA